MNCDIILIIIIIVLIFNLYCKQSNIEKMSNDITDTDITDEIERIVEARYVEDIKAIQKLTKMSSELQSNPQSNPPKLPKPLNSKQSLNISGDLNIGTLNYRETNPTISIGDSNNKMYIKNVKSNNNYSFQIQNNNNDPILKIDKGWSIVTSPDELKFKYNDEDVFKIKTRCYSETSPVPKTDDLLTSDKIINIETTKLTKNNTDYDTIMKQTDNYNDDNAYRQKTRINVLESKSNNLFGLTSGKYHSHKHRAKNPKSIQSDKSWIFQSGNSEDNNWTRDGGFNPPHFTSPKLDDYDV